MNKRKILIPILLVLIMTSCAEQDSNLRGVVITGSDMVITDSLNAYSAENSRTRYQITDWRWSIEGDASIEEDNGETIKVRANDIPGTSSSFTLRLEVCCDEYSGWSDVTTKQIVINRYEFNVTCEIHANGGNFSSMPATGETATWEMSDVNVGYWRYRIEFTGNITDLPSNINVTITWTKVNSSNFWWGNSTNSSNTITVSVPRTGGTIGYLGTILDSGGDARPTVQGVSVGNTAGTVTFESEYIETMVLTVERP